MKLSLDWLSEYIKLNLPTEDLVERLTMAGLEVESIDYIGSDTVLEIEITPNRPDCLSILGLAREVGAITAKKVQMPKIKAHKTSQLKGCVQVADKKDCSRYVATLVRDVYIQDSLPVMKHYLKSMGISTINNAVDITNFVMMETGQPLHAFDYDKLAGGKIMVRRARKGESIVTLDGVERKLDERILVIADAEKPVAIAGIMGGMGTEITSQTKNILLESAHFEMGAIRKACRILGLRSDSSYRFERNVNYEGVFTGANRAVDLLLGLTGGKLAGRQEIAAGRKTRTPKIEVKSAEIEAVLGFKVKTSSVKDSLERLGFKVAPKPGGFSVTPPSTRADIAASWDVIEEIARMTGFDRLPSQMPVIKAANITVDKRPLEAKNKIRRILTAAGLDEIVTLSMINSKALAKCRIPSMPQVKVFNPLSLDQEMMRPVLLPSFLQVAVTNINRGQKDLRFFEIGKVYFKDRERDSLGILLTGGRRQDWRIFDVKGALERIFEQVEVRPEYADTDIPTFDASCRSVIMIDGKSAGVLGKVDAQVLNDWDIKHQDVYFAGLYLDEIFSKPAKTIRYEPISEFPAITRDVSLSVKKEVPYKQIEAICSAHGGDILQTVNFIEQYVGDKIQAGHKGLVFSCQYQSKIRTLREEEVTEVHERIVQALIQDLGAIRR